MAKTAYEYNIEKRQEQFSVAYIKAIASAAGYKVSPLNPMDEDSEDIQIHQRRNDYDDDRPFYSILRVQAKCTTVQPSDDGFLHFRLPLKNYDDLRPITGDPFLLMVLCIPSQDESDWLKEENLYMVLYNKAYWFSLRGADRIPDNDTPRKDRKKTILIPTSQLLDVNGLVTIMDMLADGEIPK